MSIERSQSLSVVDPPDVWLVVLGACEQQVALAIVLHHRQGTGVTLQKDGTLNTSTQTERRQRSSATGSSSGRAEQGVSRKTAGGEGAQQQASRRLSLHSSQCVLLVSPLTIGMAADASEGKDEEERRLCSKRERERRGAKAEESCGKGQAALVEEHKN